MVITDFLERNARLYRDETALVEINPSEERDKANTWREFSLIERNRPDEPYRREITWGQFDKKANRFANLLLSRGLKRGTKVGILLMNCLEWLPVYFGILKAGCLAVPLNFRYSSDEIRYCLDLADVEALVFGPEFIDRLEPILPDLGRVRQWFYVGNKIPAFAESYRELVMYCSIEPPPVHLELSDLAAIYFSSGTTGFPKAFFLSTLSLSVTCSSNTGALFKQFLCVVLGLILFLILGVFLRDLERAKRIRWLMAGAAIGLLSLTVVLYKLGLADPKYGAANWITIGGVSVQPSEIAKICYIFAGAATLERLFRKRNLGLFILLTGVSLACLAYMSDFGTAAIFFITFLVIAYLRSGDWATLALICGGGVFAVLTMLSVKPYIMSRFATWGHAWENVTVGSGYQQSRTMSAAASGGLVGVGPGEGWLHNVGAGDTDLVFGMLCEEFGLIIAILAILAIVTLAVFAVRACRAGRSSFYIIAACAATSMMVFQTCLNVFGAVDILPLTGVTFPFVSNGGTAMIASWGLLAYLKATDTRQNASFAIRLPSRREDRQNAELSMKRTEQWEGRYEED